MRDDVPNNATLSTRVQLEMVYLRKSWLGPMWHFTMYESSFEVLRQAKRKN